uniref:FLYWCH-type domain-containing protein n=1 Tax=Glossina pallidipes TaxID=7398 RepID=A0A1A9Z9L3_GLOPL
MCELLEFMYQGVVNVKHTELQAFMKIGQLLQIKGLATNSASSAASTTSEKSSSQNAAKLDTDGKAEAISSTKANTTTTSGSTTTPTTNNSEENAGENSNSGKQTGSNSNPHTPVRSGSPALSSSSRMGVSINPTQPSNTTINKSSSDSSSHQSMHGGYHHSLTSGKRYFDYNSDTLSIHARNKLRRSLTSADHSSDNNDVSADGNSVEQINEDFFLPHISMVESRYDLNIKREAAEHHAAASLRNNFPSAAFGLDYNFYKSNSSSAGSGQPPVSQEQYPNDIHMPSDYSKNFGNHMDIPPIAPGEHWFQGKLEFMLSQRGKPLLVHDGHTFGIQYVRKDKKYWQCNLSRKFNCKARVTTTDTGEIIVTNNEHCHTEIRQHLRKDYQRNKVMMNALINLSTNRLAVENLRRHNNINNIANNLSNLQSMVAASQAAASVSPLSLGTANAESPGLLDLGKRSTNVMDLHEQKMTKHHLPFNLNTGDEEDNSDMPLDCGIHSTALRGEHDHSEHMKVDHDTNNTSHDWKYKNETI